MLGRATYFDFLGRPVDPRVREIRDFVARVRTGRLIAGYTVPFQYTDQAVAEWAGALFAAEGFGKLPLRDTAGVFAADLVSAALVQLLSPYMPFGPVSGIEKMIITKALEAALERLDRRAALPWLLALGGVGAILALLASRFSSPPSTS
ncbi:MAG: hypothetical protein WA809_08305 [Candidatus Dormiibacterota bacterium]